jgi:hypothetical protein
MDDICMKFRGFLPEPSLWSDDPERTGRYISLLLIVIEISDGNMELRNGRVGQGGVEMEWNPYFASAGTREGAHRGPHALLSRL